MVIESTWGWGEPNTGKATNVKLKTSAPHTPEATLKVPIHAFIMKLPLNVPSLTAKLYFDTKLSTPKLIK